MRNTVLISPAVNGFSAVGILVALGVNDGCWLAALGVIDGCCLAASVGASVTVGAFVSPGVLIGRFGAEVGVFTWLLGVAVWQPARSMEKTTSTAKMLAFKWRVTLGSVSLMAVMTLLPSIGSPALYGVDDLQMPPPALGIA
jgi:hypothetical protein